ncbi:MAG: hypothetical protein WBW33_30635 [Bryobacteraceae bacterium]
MKLSALVPMVMLVWADVYAADLQVRIIDATTARPKQGVHLKVYTNSDPAVHTKYPRRSFDVQTDQTGTASFGINSLTELRVTVFIQDGGCSPPLHYDVSALLRDGVVGKNQCAHTNERIRDIRASPGEIIMFWERGMSFWEALTPPDLWP